MPFAEGLTKDEHFKKHGQEMRSANNFAAATILRWQIKHQRRMTWDADEYEAFGDWILENGTYFYGSGTKIGYWIPCSHDPSDGVFIAGFRNNNRGKVLTTVFWAPSAETKYL